MPTAPIPHDVIVVGAGAAGCVVAARLSEDPGLRVLLVEAGGHNRRLAVRAPAAFSNQFETKIDWNYVTEPEENLHGRRLFEPRGKMLGGSSSMNAMMYVRGNRRDYEDWEQQGATGWGPDDVLPYYKKSEANADLAGPYHGQDGPMAVETLRRPDPVTLALIDACVEAGLDRNDDVNGRLQDGVGVSQVNQRRGVRHDTASAFLAPARRRPNLDVLTGALVHRVVLEGGRATGVELSRGRRGVELHRATQEVVLCAGAFGTPEILQRSGIGPADHLRSVGIRALVDLPAVGHHLMEHPFQFANYEIRGDALGLSDAARPRHLAHWLVHREGKLASNVAEGLGFFRTDPGLPAPDMQLILAPLFFWEHGKREHPRPAFSIGLSYVAPSSRGTVLVRSADPTQKARVRLNMLSRQSEVDAIVAGLHMAREIAAMPALAEHRGAEINPGVWVGDDRALADYVRGTVEHTYHPSCTARIGSPSDGACDPQLRVHGVDALRVADASAMPTVTRGNTHAPSIMIGERCADFIRHPRPTESLRDTVAA